MKPAIYGTKIHLLIQKSVHSFKIEQIIVSRFGSNLAISSIEKGRISCQIIPIKNYASLFSKNLFKKIAC